MSKPIKNALKAMARSREERLAAEAREQEAQREAAQLYGQLLLEAGGAELDPDQLQEIVKASVATGPAEALRRLSSEASSSARESRQRSELEGLREAA